MRTAVSLLPKKQITRISLSFAPYRTYFFRTFHNGHCYDLELFLATVNTGVCDAPQRPKEFTEAYEHKVVNNFKRMLDTLRLPGA